MGVLKPIGRSLRKRSRGQAEKTDGIWPPHLIAPGLLLTHTDAADAALPLRVFAVNAHVRAVILHWPGIDKKQLFRGVAQNFSAPP